MRVNIESKKTLETVANIEDVRTSGRLTFDS